jgi:hypothetical protein
LVISRAIAGPGSSPPDRNIVRLSFYFLDSAYRRFLRELLHIRFPAPGAWSWEDGEANHAKQHLRLSRIHAGRNSCGGSIASCRTNRTHADNNFARTMEALADMGDFDPFSTVEYL